MPNQYDLVIKILEYQESKAAEAGTTTTNITITAHGLETGDFIVNETRRATTQNSAERGSRKITYVDDNNFTIDTAIASQASGDTIRIYKWVDRTEHLKSKSFSLTKKAQGESYSNFAFMVNYEGGV